MAGNSFRKTRIGLVRCSSDVVVHCAWAEWVVCLTCHIVGCCGRSYVEFRLLDVLLETVHHDRQSTPADCADVELIQLDGPLRVGSGPGEEIFIGPLSRGGIDKNIYTKREVLSFNCKGTWSSCERVICYNRQTIYYRERQTHTQHIRAPGSRNLERLIPPPKSSALTVFMTLYVK